MARRISFAAITAVALAGCTSGHVYETHHLDRGTGLSVDASQRLVNNVQPAKESLTGQIRPERVICAEPSPDVGVAIAAALAAQLQAKVEAGTPVEAGVGMTRELSTTLMNLSERTATIQLLRDVLYRACEAYQNGAISSTGYSLILSRFDTMTTTMLAMEQISGRPSRTHSLSTGSGTGLRAITDQITATEAELTKTTANLKAKQADLDKAKEDKKSEDEISALSNAVKELAQAEEKLSNQLALLRLMAAMEGVAVAGSSGTVGEVKPDEEVGKLILEAQKAYFTRTGTDFAPLIASCVNGLSIRPINQLDQYSQEFKTFCFNFLSMATDRLKVGTEQGTLIAIKDAEAKRDVPKIEAEAKRAAALARAHALELCTREKTRSEGCTRLIEREAAR